jgi:hypothetical protein
VYEVKYLERLATVYLDKYEQHGFPAAKAWYDGFLNDDLREAIKPYVEKEVTRRSNKKGGK